MQDFELKDKMRIVQELVPGRQITLLHIIANPDPILYQKLGLDPRLDYSHSAIGVLTVSPAETAVITADISMKTANVQIKMNGTVGSRKAHTAPNTPNKYLPTELKIAFKISSMIYVN